MPPLSAVLRRALPNPKYRKLAIVVAVTLGLVSLLTHAFQEPAGPPAREPTQIEVRAEVAVASGIPTAAREAPPAKGCGRSAAAAESRRPGAYCPARTLATELIIANAE